MTVKQYRLNQIVEAAQIGVSSYEDLRAISPYEAYISDTQNLLTTNSWLVKTQSGQVLIIPSEIFEALYSEVHE